LISLMIIMIMMISINIQKEVKSIFAFLIFNY
jgi:hypothetical protein